MGKIEDQVLSKQIAYIDCLEWYAKSIDKLNAEHTRSVNDLNMAFNERMAEIRAMSLPKKKKSANSKKK